MEYIKIKDLKDGYLYRIHARNASYGIYNAAHEGFIISRYKFGLNYSFEEYYRDGRPFGTAGPLKEVEKSPFKPDEDGIMVEKSHPDGKKFWERAKEDEILEYLNKQCTPESTSDETVFCHRCKREFVIVAVHENGYCYTCNIERQKEKSSPICAACSLPLKDDIHPDYPTMHTECCEKWRERVNKKGWNK